MAVELTELGEGKILEVWMTGKLTHEDYKQLGPEFERLVKKHGKVDVLVEMSDFHGWSARALWDDVGFDIRHHGHIGRLALVGEKKWQKWMASFCRPFTSAEIRYFPKGEVQAARAWLEEALVAKTS